MYVNYSLSEWTSRNDEFECHNKTTKRHDETTKETSRRIELVIRRVDFRNRRAETTKRHNKTTKRHDETTKRQIAITKRRVEHFFQDLPSYLCCRLEEVVAKSRARVYFEQQILALLLVFHQTYNLSRNKFFMLGDKLRVFVFSYFSPPLLSCGSLADRLLQLSFILALLWLNSVKEVSQFLYFDLLYVRRVSSRFGTLAEIGTLAEFCTGGRLLFWLAGRLLSC